MTTLALQPDGSAGKDAQIYGGAATTNYGGGTLFSVGYNSSEAQEFRALIEFPLSGIPAGSTIDSAEIGLSTGSFQEGTANINRLRRLDWVEAEATWNIYKTGSSWTTAGCSSTDDDYYASDTVTFPSTLSGFGAADVTAHVAAAFAAGTAYAARIKRTAAYSGAAIVSYRSSDNTTAAYRPKLTVEYTEGSGGGGIAHRVIGSGIVNSRAIVRGAA